MARNTVRVSSAAQTPTTAEEFFAGEREGLRIFNRVVACIREIGPAEIRVSRSEIAFRRSRGFAFVWRPDRYLKPTGVPAVLSIALPREATSPRFKSVVHPSPRVWMHHIELRAVREVDAEVAAWLAEAYAGAGPRLVR